MTQGRMGTGKKEAQIQLPDTRAARMLMEELKALRPDYDFDAPKDLKKQWLL